MTYSNWEVVWGDTMQLQVHYRRLVFRTSSEPDVNFYFPLFEIYTFKFYLWEWHNYVTYPVKMELLHLTDGSLWILSGIIITWISSSSAVKIYKSTCALCHNELVMFINDKLTYHLPRDLLSADVATVPPIGLRNNQISTDNWANIHLNYSSLQSRAVK